MGTDFLETILEHKKNEIAAAQRQTPENLVREKALAVNEQKRPFADRLAAPGTHIIAEIKRASPSKGDIRPDLDPAAYARAYEAGGASALSVLTETAYFKGSVADMQAARGATRLPVLRKDFILSTYQLYESKVVGADAVLLIVRILSPAQLADYLALARELDLDCLVEVHSESDLENACEAGARLIGINNRNLKSFETDIRIAMQLASRMTGEQIPVAASGITRRSDVEENLKVGIRSFLIGEHLVRADDPVRFLRTLRGEQ